MEKKCLNKYLLLMGLLWSGLVWNYNKWHKLLFHLQGYLWLSCILLNQLKNFCGFRNGTLTSFIFPPAVVGNLRSLTKSHCGEERKCFAVLEYMKFLSYCLNYLETTCKLCKANLRYEQTAVKSNVNTINFLVYCMQGTPWGVEMGTARWFCFY